MALHTDLLRQARRLAQQEPRRPKQASLRRAVSAAYYAVFHLLTDQAGRFMVGGNSAERVELRNGVRRAFVHKHMREACQQFVSGKSKWLTTANITPTPALVGIAETFVGLQQERHEADYHHGRNFQRPDVLANVSLAETAIQDWGAIKGTPEADAFLIALLLAYRS